MFGITNAQGADFPYLNARYELLSAKIGKLEKNPAVGTLTRYAGFDWLVVHWDAEGCMYLALKDIYHLASYTDSSGPVNVGFKDSIMESEIFNFEYLLRSREDENLKLLKEVAYDGLTCKAFIPTREQVRSEFSLFKMIELNDMACGNAIALYNGEPTAWRLADATKSAIKPYVKANATIINLRPRTLFAVSARLSA